MLERSPVHVVAPGVALVGPAQHRELVVDARAGVPDVGGGAVVGHVGDDVPELGGPAVDAEVLVGPVVGGARHGGLLVPREVLVHRVDLVARGLGEAGAELLPRPHVQGRQGAVGLRARRPQEHATVGVVGVEAADVGPSRHGPHRGGDLGLAGGEVAGAGDAGAPAGRVVAVQVETFGRARGGHREAVVVVDGAFAEHAEEGAVVGAVVGPAGRHEAGLVGVGLPGAVGVGHAQREDATVAVDVVLVEAGGAVPIAPRPRARARAQVPGRVGHGQLGPVGVQAGHDVERPRGAGARHGGAGVGEEPVDEVQRGHRAGELGGVDVGVDPHRRLGVVGAGGGVGDGHQPDVAALVRAADALERGQRGVLAHQARQFGGELVVAEEAVEGHGHGWTVPGGPGRLRRVPPTMRS